MNTLFGTRWWSWPRLVCLGLTVAVLVFLFRRIETAALAQSLTNIRWSWFAAAFALYGLALMLGGLRWHITLHAIRCVVHARASIRFAFIGHFFFLVLFGAAAGDVAKSALYARWYRFGVPELTAAAPIDRALGVVGTIVVGAIAASVGFVSGGFRELDLTQFPMAISAWFVGIAVVTALALTFWKPKGESWWARGWR